MNLQALPALALVLGRRFVTDLAACLRFYTRLPVPPPRSEALWSSDAFAQALRLAPLAGFAIGAIASVVLVIGARGLGLPPLVAVTLALATQILVSGALHEDGLADVADGFGGGSHPMRKLDIMRDSRIGTFGAVTLVLSLVLRIVAVTALLDRYGLPTAAASLPAAAAASRGLGLLPLAMLRPARSDGLSHAAGVLSPFVFGSAVALAVFLGMTLAFMGGLTETRALCACGAAFAASLAVTRLAWRQIGGQTGDVAGAAQQAAEIAYLLALLVAPWRG